MHNNSRRSGLTALVLFAVIAGCGTAAGEKPKTALTPEQEQHARDWQRERDAAAREDHAAIAARFPRMGWMNGAWCGSSMNVRIGVLDETRARFALFKAPLLGWSGFSVNTRLLRQNGDVVEAWAADAEYPLWKIRKGADGTLVLAGRTTYWPETIDPRRPFSGSVREDYPSAIAFHRCE